MPPYSATNPKSVARIRLSPPCAIFSPERALMAFFLQAAVVARGGESDRLMSGVLPLSRGTERSNCGLENCAATGHMPFVCHRNSANRVFGTTFDNHAGPVAWQWATALIPNASHGDAVDGEPGRADTDYCPPMRSGIVEANDVRHA